MIRFCLLLLIAFSQVATSGAGVPTWNKPASGSSFELDRNTCITAKTVELDVISGDPQDPILSVQAHADLFGINYLDAYATFYLQCKSAITQSQQSQFSVILRATSGMDSLYSEITLTLTFPQSNRAPVFSNLPSSKTLAKDSFETDGSTVLFTVTVTDPDSDVVTISIPAGSTFTVVGKDIKLTGSLANLASPQRITVTATDNGSPPQSASADLTLTLLHRPKFTDPANSSDIIYVCETLTGGDEVMTLAASDADTAQNSLTFSMDDSPAVTKSKFILVNNVLKVAGGVSFDYEGIGAVLEYSIILKVSDGQLNSTLSTKIQLEDYNDNTPTFNLNNCSFNIWEPVLGGVSVARVNATDADATAPNNKLSYSLKGTDLSDLSLNGSSGVISVASGITLTYSRKPLYEFIVNATDGGDPMLSATISCTIKVKTVPKFENLNAAKTIKIAENVVKGTTIFNLTVSDQDTNAVPSVSIKSQSAPWTFVLDGLALKTNATLDHETTAMYTIDFSAADDTRADYKTDSSLLTINITDVNEAPLIVSVTPASPITISELTTAGTSVFSLSATDQDKTAPNNTISYSLSGSTDFSINATTGRVAVSSGVTLDYTIKKTYQLQVMATDGGTPPLSTSRQVVVNLATEPVFVNLAQNVSVNVSENVAVETVVFNLTVQDEDGVGPLQISLLTPSDVFRLDSNLVKTKTVPDAEKQQKHVLIFKVTDGTYVKESAQLTMTLIDLNDNTPDIQQVPNTTVAENRPVGYPILSVTAGDLDVTSPNNLLTFNIQAGNSDGYFAINATTGKLTLAAIPKSISKKTYPLTVRVTDGGTPARTADVDFIITIDEKTVDECSSNPCKNNGTCSSFINVYFCNCKQGWDGVECQNNVNDCATDSCKNNGTCIDGVNSFTCNCSAGWSGNTCTQACSGNTWGRNCANSCNCPNVSRLASDVGNQQCNIVTGACRCNNMWSGIDCNTDYDECQNKTICAATPNTVCENTIGGYNCPCKVGFKDETNNNGTKVCVQDTSRGNLTFPDGLLVLPVKASLNAPCPDNLAVPSVYHQKERELKDMIERRINRTVQISDIWCGSLEFKFYIVSNNTASEATFLAVVLQNIRDGQPLTLGNQTVTANNITVNNVALEPTSMDSGSISAKVCEVRNTYSPCGADHRCIYENGVATCQYIQQDNLKLILGLGLGLLLPMLMILILVVIAFFYLRNRQQDKHGKHRSWHSNSDTGLERQRRDWRSWKPYMENSYDNRISSMDRKDPYGMSAL